MKVIPIQRLPKHLSEFDYSVPAELEAKIKPGQLVTIPFRKSEIFGLVLKHESSSPIDTNIKSITSIVNEEPFLNESQIQFLQTISQWYEVSLATLLKMSLLPLQKNKLKKINLSRNTYHITRTKLPKPHYFFYHDQIQHKKHLLSNIKGQALILVPEIHLIDEVRQLLPIKLQKQTVVWHSELSQKQKFSRWLEIRNQEKNIIIGTRGAVFLPFQNLQSIIIDYEHEENHKHWDQAPRFHAKDVAKLLAKTYGAKLNLMSYSPSCESYFHIHKNNYQQKQAPPIYKGRLGGVTLVDIQTEHRAGNYSIFSGQAEEAIIDSKNDVFLFLNRLGFATSISCESCGHMDKCNKCGSPLVYHEKTQTLHCHYCHTEKNLALTCPKCSGTMTKLKGKGIQFVEKEVERMFDKTKEIIRIDSDRKEDLPYSKKPRIIIGTEMAFHYIKWDKTDTIIFLDIDRQLQIPEFKTEEHVWHLIQEVNFRKKAKAQFLIQTFNPKHLIFRSLDEPDRFYRTDLNYRRSLGYPPYNYLVRYFYGHGDIRVARKESDRLYSTFKQALTKAQKKAIITGPIEMHPRYYRRKFWYNILVKLDAKTWQEDLIFLNSFVPQSWRVDPRPISILSP